MAEGPDAQGEARALLASIREGSLATLSRDGAPFSSFVTVAPDVSLEPLMLLSDLAVHTKNLARDPRASLLLVAAAGPEADALARSRLTLIGRAGRAGDQERARTAFLAVHRQASFYAGFRDFAVYRLSIAEGHLVAGFGRIAGLSRDELLQAPGLTKTR